MTPKKMIISPVSRTRLLDVQPTILLTIKRSAPATTSAIPKFFLNSLMTVNYTPLLFFWRDELIALAMNVDDLNLIVCLQMLTQLGDIDVH